jgi:hypothetical protein
MYSVLALAAQNDTEQTATEETGMAVQQNTDHIQTTHIGSLPRPHQLLDILKAKYAGQPYDEGKLNSILAQAVAECVRKQVECGIEIVTDGVSTGSNRGPIRSSSCSSRRFPLFPNTMPNISRKR